MGVDFVKKAAPNFTRALDRGALRLRTPDLFSRDIPLVARSASASICGGVQVDLTDRVIIRQSANGLVLQRGNAVIAHFHNPPSEFVSFVRSGAGVAQGEIKAVRPISQTVEVGFCE